MDWPMVSAPGRRLTRTALIAYAVLAVALGALLVTLGVTRRPISLLDHVGSAFVIAVAPGFLLCLAWVRSRRLQDPLRTTRGLRTRESWADLVGPAMPRLLQLACVAVLLIAFSAFLSSFAVLWMTSGSAPLPSQVPRTACQHPFDNHGTTVCPSDAQAAAIEGTFPAGALCFSLYICVICTGGVLEQKHTRLRGRITR